MRRKYSHSQLDKEKGVPKYICPACHQMGLLLEASDKSVEGCQQICRVCGFHYLPLTPGYSFPFSDAEKKWGAAWKECGAEVLFDKTKEERVNYFTKLNYAFLGQTLYIPTDEEIENRTFDVELLFSQRGYSHNSDSSRRITVRCEDGKSWEFPYETNTLFALDDPMKYFTIAEEKERGVLCLAVSEYLSKLSSGRKMFRGFDPGIFPEAYGGVYLLDEELVLVGLDKKEYSFDVVC